MPRTYRSNTDNPILLKAEEYSYKKWDYKDYNGWVDMNRNLFDVVDDSIEDYKKGYEDCLNDLKEKGIIK